MQEANTATPFIAPEIMTAKQLAQYLQVHYETVLEMVNKNEIPHTVVKKRFRFRKTHIDRWFDNRMKGKAA